MRPSILSRPQQDSLPKQFNKLSFYALNNTTKIHNYISTDNFIISSESMKSMKNILNIYAQKSGYSVIQG